MTLIAGKSAAAKLGAGQGKLFGVKGGVGITVIGDQALLAKFERLTNTQQSKVVRPAVNMATSPWVKKAKQLARRFPRGRYRGSEGVLAKALGKSVKKYRRSGKVYGIVGARQGRGTRDKQDRPRDPWYYDHLVEFGTKRWSGRPIIGKAFMRMKAASVIILRREIGRRIEKEAAKP